jgi:predicted Zn-dependent protease
LFQQALGFDDSYVPNYLGNARCEAFNQHFDTARTEIDKAIKLQPKNSLVWMTLGELETSRGKFADAGRRIAALQLRPTSIEALLGRAVADTAESNRCRQT